MKPNILVVCSGNINRSAVAEQMFKDKGYTQVDSAGLGKTALKGLPATKNIMNAYGKYFEHKSKQVDFLLVEWADVIYCMGSGQVKKLNKRFLTNKACTLANYNIADPHFSKDYSLAVVQIKKEVERILCELE